VWTQDDDQELEYGKWHVYTAKTTLAEEYKIHPPQKPENIWPHWSEGVPTKLRRAIGSPRFYLKGVHYRYREHIEFVKLDWNYPRPLSSLRKNYRLLPSSYRSEWSGVYRIFSPDTTIDRCCGRDPTGTLYIGQAGSRGRSWSILRTRIMAIARAEHHAIMNASFCELIQQTFPLDSLSIEWAYTGKKINRKGEEYAEATLAETWLLACYNNSYGEYPPWNQGG